MKKLVDTNNKQDKGRAKSTSAGKRYSIGSIFVVTVIFVIIFLFININRTSKYFGVIKDIKKYTLEIERLKYEKKMLVSKKETYKSPGRILEIALESGLLKTRDENKDDIIYIKINSDKRERRYEEN